MFFRLVERKMMSEKIKLTKKFCEDIKPKDKKFLVDMFRFFRQKMKQQREKNPPEDKLDTDIPSDIPS